MSNRSSLPESDSKTTRASFPIDIVIPWVDDTDPLWQIERDLFLDQEGRGSFRSFDAGVDRFRSWDNLQYIFRGIETYMPWVRTVHLITNSQAPEWLNLSSPKLNFVKHRDYIPHEFLPTFNSHTIELNLHRIPSLAEHFIYFNDDTFVIRPMSPSDFFSAEGLPRDQFGLWRVKTAKYDSVLPHVSLNNMAILNQHFDQGAVLRKEYSKLLDPRNGVVRLMLTVLMAAISQKDFANILFHHMPAAFLKQTFREVWNAEPEILRNTSSNKFRSKDDVSQYLMRAWQMVSGNFVPKNFSIRGEHFTYITDDFSVLTAAIDKRRLNLKSLDMFCVSDERISNFDQAKSELNTTLEQILSEKSSFEAGYANNDTTERNKWQDVEIASRARAMQGSL